MRPRRRRYSVIKYRPVARFYPVSTNLRAKPEFNFDSGDIGTLEAGIATLRVANALHLRGRTKMTLIKPPKNEGAADLVREKGGKRICFAVKALTEQSTGGEHKFLEDQLYDKIFDLTGKAKKQLAASAAQLNLVESDYQRLVNRLKEQQEHTLLSGINGVLFVTSAGVQFPFIDDQAKVVNF